MVALNYLEIKQQFTSYNPKRNYVRLSSILLSLQRATIDPVVHEHNYAASNRIAFNCLCLKVCFAYLVYFVRAWLFALIICCFVCVLSQQIEVGHCVTLLTLLPVIIRPNQAFKINVIGVAQVVYIICYFSITCVLKYYYCKCVTPDTDLYIICKCVHE